jgi:hypothetical protein
MKFGATQPEYAAVVEKRFNKRFIARPDYVRLAASTDVSTRDHAGAVAKGWSQAGR